MIKKHIKRCSTLLFIREIQIKKTRYHYTPTRMGVIKTKTPPIIEGCGATGTLIDNWWECSLVQPLWKTGSICWSWTYAFSMTRQLNSGTSTREKSARVHPNKDLFENVHNSFIVIAPNWIQSKYLPTGKQIHKWWYIHAVVESQ